MRSEVNCWSNEYSSNMNFRMYTSIKYAFRCTSCAIVGLPVSFEHGGRRLSTETVDVAPGGCFVREDSGVCRPGDRLILTLMLHDDDPLEIVGEVMWLSTADSQGKPPGFAVQFQSMRKADAARLSERLKASGMDDESA